MWKHLCWLLSECCRCSWLKVVTDSKMQGCMIEEATEDLVKGDAIFNCLVFSCLSICNSLGGAVTVVISFFQPYTQGPSHVFKGGVMTTYTKIFSFNGALVLMIPLISSFVLMPSNCMNAHSPVYQLYITLLRCNSNMNSKNCKKKDSWTTFHITQYLGS